MKTIFKFCKNSLDWFYQKFIKFWYEPLTLTDVVYWSAYMPFSLVIQLRIPPKFTWIKNWMTSRKSCFHLKNTKVQWINLICSDGGPQFRHPSVVVEKWRNWSRKKFFYRELPRFKIVLSIKMFHETNKILLISSLQDVG